MRLGKKMTKIFTLPLLVTALTAAPVLAQGFTKTAKELGFEKLKIKVGASASDLSGIDKSTAFRTSLNIQTRFTLTGDIKFDFDGGLKYETGASKSSFNQRRYAPNSGLTYNYAYLNYEAFNIFRIEAGALDNRDRNYMSLFVNYATTAMGAREIIKFESDLLDIYASATQAVPYNDELSQRIGAIDEKRSKFFQEMVTAKIKFSPIEVTGQVGHFGYEDLASDVAKNDRYFGNSVTVTGDFGEYNYTFKGWLYSVSAKINLSKQTSITPMYGLIKNDEAPTGKNEGHYTGVEMQTNIFDNYIKLKALSFENESDTAPAFYSRFVGKNNYKGQSLDLSIENPENLTTTVKYINRTPIESNIFLGDEKVISIGLRKSYDIF